MVLSQEDKNERKSKKSRLNKLFETKKATLNQALPPCFQKQGCITGREINSLPGYRGGCPSAVERQAEPVFWQLKRVRVCAGTC